MSARAFRLCLIHLERDDPTETFIRAPAERLPCTVLVVHGDGRRPLYLDRQPIMSPALGARLARRARWAYRRRRRADDAERDELTLAYAAAFRRARCDAVLAEYGHVGVQAMAACARLELPLIVHFHGYDAHSRLMIERYGAQYRHLFTQAAAIVAVSNSMREALLALGAPATRTHYVANGVDPQRFRGAKPEHFPPIFLAVGRFVEKKAPQVTIAAFAKVEKRHPGAQLRMIGDGPLQAECARFADKVGVGRAVVFLGSQPHEVVAEEMRSARAFVQHSVVASDGDSEGMPNGILEASASGLPVVSTTHAGIPDVVLDGETGFLVEEHDVDGMAERMCRLLEDPVLAGVLGRAARERVCSSFSLDCTIEHLWTIIRDAATERRHD